MLRILFPVNKKVSKTNQIQILGGKSILCSTFVKLIWSLKKSYAAQWIIQSIVISSEISLKKMVQSYYTKDNKMRRAALELSPKCLPILRHQKKLLQKSSTISPIYRFESLGMSQTKIITCSPFEVLVKK